MKTYHYLLVAAAVSLLVSACAVTQVEPPQPVTAPAAFKEDGIWRHSATAQPAPDPGDWWTVFNDVVLNDLVARLVVGNENLKALSAQVASARATVEASNNAMWPTLSVGPSMTRSRSVANDQTSTGRTTNSVALSVNGSWDLDLWGRLSGASSQAKAAYQASAEDLAAARLSAQATLTQTYLALRSAEAQFALLTRSVAAYEKSLALTQARYDGGMVSRSDVLQAQGQLKSTQAQLFELRSQRAQLEHALAVLVGVPPSELNLVRGEGLLPDVPAVPALLPSELLARRPDISAARHRVEAAYSQIGVADAAYFPSLNLSASAGFRHDALANLISAPNLFWSIGPSLTEMIFNGGQRQLASAQARANADQATANYRQSVLTALQEVEDNLVLTDQLRQEALTVQEALRIAQRNLEVVTAQYESGTVSYLNVVVAQTAVLNTEGTMLQLRNRQLAAVNSLLKNAAGSWRVSQSSPVQK